MSNRPARTLLYAPSALALTLRQSTAAPTQSAPKEAISNLSSTAALPLPHDAPAVPKTTRPVTGTAQPALYRFSTLPPTPRKQTHLPRPLPATHLNPLTTSCLRPTQTPWTPIQMRPDPPLPLPYPPPPGLESPLEFATPRAPLRPALMGPSGSTTRTGRPQPNGEPSPSPAPRDQSASLR